MWIATNWKILKETGISDHLTCLLRNLYAAQEATVRMGHETMDWFKIGKGIHQGCILSPCLFNSYAEYIIWNARLAEAQAQSRLPGEMSITSDMQMTASLWQKVKRNWKASWWRWKKGVEKAGLKLNIQNTKIIASSPIISWQIDEETMETVRDFIFLGSEITEDGDCRHESKINLLLGRKAIDGIYIR